MPRVVGHAEIGPAGGNAADGADLGGERQHVRHAFVGGYGCQPVGYSDAEIDNGVRREFQGSATQNEQSFIKRKLRKRSQRHDDISAECRLVVDAFALHVEFLGILGDDDIVDENARHLDRLRMQRSCFRDIFHLSDDDAAGISWPPGRPGSASRKAPSFSMEILPRSSAFVPRIRPT